ncbi:MAG: hypothetical protein CMD89_01495 [Gammaproteobacteria bacterium]|nr:hypothetical protein [Gammaproteobacteria bacterium]|tara:strand:+ start:8861 stop:9283 length:423 start_codon:yes stop_codon:yes gene_type:complete
MLLDKNKLTGKKVINEINIVPYVDVMLVLLVIFMVVTPLAIQGIEINLPKAQTSEIESQNNIPFTIDVDKNGKYFIEEDNQRVEVSIGFLEDRFSRIIDSNPEIEIIIRGDSKADYESIASLLAVLQNNGANNFSLATQP